MSLFQGLSIEMTIYWILALFGSLIFVIQLILAIFGLGAGHDVDVDTSAVGGHDVGTTHADSGFSVFKLFSVQSVIAFISFFGWGGIIAGQCGLPDFMRLLIAFGCGFMMMVLVSLLLFYLLKLQQVGNIDAADFVGCQGTVYFNIPPGRTDSGKVTVNFKGCTRQVLAVADEELPTGTAVTIVQQIDGRRFLVKKI